METLCSNYRLVKGGQNRFFPQTYSSNCNRLLILINDWSLIKINLQEKKIEVRGSPSGGLRGGLIYVVTIHNYPYPLRPHWMTPHLNFFSVDLF